MADTQASGDEPIEVTESGVFPVGWTIKVGVSKEYVDAVASAVAQGLSFSSEEEFDAYRATLVSEQ